jgi:DNA mismatch endonuclease (patch repair protein)
VVFVHGCFWHLHDCPYGRVKPATRADFWAAKRGENAERDRRNASALAAAGWNALVIWECETRDRARLERALKRFLG